MAKGDTSAVAALLCDPHAEVTGDTLDFRTHFQLKAYGWLCMPLAESADELKLEYGPYDRCIAGHSRIATTLHSCVKAACQQLPDGSALAGLQALLAQYHAQVVAPLQEMEARLASRDKSLDHDAKVLIERLKLVIPDILKSAWNEYAKIHARLKSTPIIDVQLMSDGEWWTAISSQSPTAAQGVTPQEALNLIAESLRESPVNDGADKNKFTTKANHGVSLFADCNLLPTTAAELNCRYRVRIARYAPEMRSQDYDFFEEMCDRLELKEFPVLLKDSQSHDGPAWHVAIAVKTGAAAQGFSDDEALDLLLLSQVATWRRFSPDTAAPMRGCKPQFREQFEVAQSRGTVFAARFIPWRIRRRLLVFRSPAIASAD